MIAPAKPEYRSSVLTNSPCEACCGVCDFLNGKRDVRTMEFTIAVLDAQLANRELAMGIQTNAMVQMASNLAKVDSVALRVREFLQSHPDGIDSDGVKELLSFYRWRVEG